MVSFSIPRSVRSLYRSDAGYHAVQTHYNRMLARYPVPYESRFVSTRYGDTHVIISGAQTAPPVVLVHGLGVHAMMWQPNIAALSRHFRVYALDVIGDGGRSEAARPSMLDASYAHWLADVLDVLRLPQAYLAGMSLGGWLALNTALYYPQRVCGLYLVAPAGLVTLNTSLLMQWLFSIMPTSRLNGLDTATLLAKLTGTIDNDLSTMVQLATAHHIPKRVPPVPIFSGDALAQIQVPVTIVVGTADEMFSAARIHQRAGNLPAIQNVYIVDGAGHGINATHADEVANHMIEQWSA
ncbi:MAG: alpha/beta fold hydrolase [Chloroflexota bacterium]